MNGIICLLDHKHQKLYSQWMAEAVAKFNAPPLITPPHITLHMAEQYGREKLLTTLQEMAWQMEPFKLQVSGLGVFTGDNTVVYGNVVRSRPLTILHEQFCTLLDPLTNYPHPYSRPDNWVPHITICHGGAVKQRLGDILLYLNQFNFYQTIEINKIAYWDNEAQKAIEFCFTP